jgi:hypothetical protein
MIRLIGLLGAKGSGKDTLAQFLIERLGFVRISFADALYQEVAQAYGVSVEFLGKRDTKETPLPELKLANCKDENFVHIALQAVKVGSLEEELQVPRSPRWTLQLWGTEYRRKGSRSQICTTPRPPLGSPLLRELGAETYWLDKVASLIKANPDARYVITDVRFLNEAAMVRDFGGVLIRVRRPLLEQREAAAREAGTSTALHPSETELVNYPVDSETFNSEGRPEGLLEGLYDLLPELRGA